MLSLSDKHVVLTKYGVTQIGEEHFDLTPMKVYKVVERDGDRVKVLNDEGIAQLLVRKHYRFVKVQFYSNAK